MSEALRQKAVSNDVGSRLAFFKALQALTTRAHVAEDVDAILFDLTAELCELFAAERMTIYVHDEANDELVARVKTGRSVPQEIRLQVGPDSIAGFVALSKQSLNIADVRDVQALRDIAPTLRMRSDIGESSGITCREMLVAPMLEPESGRLRGVIQFINHLHEGPFPNVMEEGLLGLAPALAVAFARSATRPPTLLRSRFDALVADGKVSGEELQQVVREARESGTGVSTHLLERFGVTLAELGDAAARYYNVPYEPFRSDRVRQMDLLRNIKREYVERNRWLPLEETEEGIVILAVDPEQVRAARIAHNVFPRNRLLFRVTTAPEFMQTVEHFFAAAFDDASVSDLLSGMGDEEPDSSMADELNAAADNELVKLVNRIIIDAHRQGASDIHIEPQPGKAKTTVRFRRDGVLVPYIQVPASYRNPLVTRIKIMCDLDISERRRPQDGKILFRKYAPLDVELRVATVPTAGGLEDVVMRILASGEPVPIDELGLLPHNRARLEEIVSRPYGLFFVCGPTGSGKTTTLHSILGTLNTPETKIWTIEDPVEITQPGLRQVQVNRKAGVDFASMMRAFLRADPDVLMVGEMRDAETVGIGIEASLTGHLVLTTLHTNSAPESVARLLDMGMDPFNFADALLGVLAQRLARRLCTHCREAYHPDEGQVQRLVHEYCEDLRGLPELRDDPAAAAKAVLAEWREHYADGSGQFTLYRAVGCDECNKGYKGRVGLHELMPGSVAVKALIQERAPVSQLVARALTDGMRTLRQDGIEKVLAGITDMQQVRKVCIR